MESRFATSDHSGARESATQLLLREILETLADSRSLSATLEAIASSVRTHLAFQSCAILLEQSETDLLLIEGAAGIPGPYVDAVNGSHPIHIENPDLSEGPSSEAFRTGAPVIVEDTRTDLRFRRWRRLADKHQIRSLISVPLRSRGGLIGTLNCYQHEPRSYDSVEVDALIAVGTQAGIAIDVARMVEGQKESIRRLNELSQTLEEQRRLLEQSAEIHDALMDLVLTNQRIPVIADTLARVTDCPVLVQDQFFHILARSNVDGRSLSAPSSIEEATSPFRHRDDKRDDRTPIEVDALPGQQDVEPRAIAPIVAGRDLLGYVSLGLPSLPASPLTLRALEHAATVFALHMVKDRLTHEAELRVRRGFADELVAGRYENVDQMRDRARYLGYDLRGPFQVLVFDIDQFDQFAAANQLTEPDIDALRLQFFEALQGAAKLHEPHALVAGRNDQLVMILTEMDETRADVTNEVIRAVRRTVGRTLPGISLSVGIGRIHTELDQVRISHDEARRSLKVIRRLNGTDKSVRYDDLGSARLIFSVEDPGELLDFAHARLGPILTYDRMNDGNLMETLTAYLRHNQSVVRAAEQLPAHPNTIRYRLRKVEDLLGDQLSSTSFLLDIQFASLILQLVDDSANA